MTAHTQVRRPRSRSFAVLSSLAAVLALSTLLAAQDARRFALDSVSGLRLHNVTATPATVQGKAGIKVAMSEEAQRQLQTRTPEEQQKLAMSGGTVEQLAVIEGLEFDNGIIEAEIAGAPMSGAAGHRHGGALPKPHRDTAVASATAGDAAGARRDLLRFD